MNNDLVTIFDIADMALKEIIDNPCRKYTAGQISEIIGCNDIESRNVFAIIKNYGYVHEDINNTVRISNAGGNFLLSGGFKEQIRREKLMTQNIEASIKSFKTSKIIAIVAAFIAFCGVLIQIFK